MSNSSKPSPLHDGVQSTSFPRAIIHKRILETAESRPEASLKEISNEVSGATTDIVDRVLEDYGDPGTDAPNAESLDEVDDQSGTEDLDDIPDTIPDALDVEEVVEEPDSTADEVADSEPDPVDITQKQYKTLQAIAEHPQATQRDLAEQLGVTPSTVNYRLNSIPEFQWVNRHEFVPSALSNANDRMAAATGTETRRDDREGAVSMETTQGCETPEEIDALRERIESLERTIEAHGQEKTNEQMQETALSQETQETAQSQEAVAAGDSPGIGEDTALVRKILRACMDADYVTEEDELQIIETFMASGGACE